MFSKTTKTISLVLISSALVFTGWGASGHITETHYQGNEGYEPSHPYYGGSSFWWFHSTYINGSSGIVTESRSGTTGKIGVHSNGSVSERGGFGSIGSAHGVGE